MKDESGVVHVTYQDVRDWILMNSHDKQTMDELNRLTYVFTSKYDARAVK